MSYYSSSTVQLTSVFLNRYRKRSWPQWLRRCSRAVSEPSPQPEPPLHPSPKKYVYTKIISNYRYCSCQNNNFITLKIQKIVPEHLGEIFSKWIENKVENILTCCLEGPRKKPLWSTIFLHCPFLTGSHDWSYRNTKLFLCCEKQMWQPIGKLWNNLNFGLWRKIVKLNICKWSTFYLQEGWTQTDT